MFQWLRMRKVRRDAQIEEKRRAELAKKREAVQEKLRRESPLPARKPEGDGHGGIWYQRDIDPALSAHLAAPRRGQGGTLDGGGASGDWLDPGAPSACSDSGSGDGGGSCGGD